MSVQKRLVTVGERHTATVAAIAARVEARWPKVEAVAAALTPPTLRAAGTSDGHGKGGHADPVATVVLFNVGGTDDEENPDAKDRYAYDDLRDAVRAWLEQGKAIEREQIRYLKEHPDTHSQRTDDLKSLCTDVGCDFRAERQGLCWKHYRQHLAGDGLHTPDQDIRAPSTPDCYIPDSSSPVAPSSTSGTTATCGRCGWTTPAQDAEHAQLLLAEHHIDGH